MEQKELTKTIMLISKKHKKPWSLGLNEDILGLLSKCDPSASQDQVVSFIMR